jgi:hypothetical protein
VGTTGGLATKIIEMGKSLLCCPVLCKPLPIPIPIFQNMGLPKSTRDGIDTSGFLTPAK